MRRLKRMTLMGSLAVFLFVQFVAGMQPVHAQSAPAAVAVAPAVEQYQAPVKLAQTPKPKGKAGLVTTGLSAVAGLLGGTLGSAAGGLVSEVATFWLKFVIFGFVVEGAIMLINNLLIWSLQSFILLTGYNGFLNSYFVNMGWTTVRDVTNLFFVVILLVIAFATVLRVSSYQYQQLLPKFVIAIFLVNFSRTIVGIAIDASQVIMTTFAAALVDVGAGNFIKLLKIDQWLQPANIQKVVTQGGDALKDAAGSSFANSAVDALRSITPIDNYVGLVLTLAIGFFTLTVTLTMLIILVYRIVALWILIILSPLAFLMSVLPSTRQYFSQWLTMLVKQLTVGPVLIFFVWLALSTAQQNADTFNLKDTDDYISTFSEIVKSGNNPNAKAADTEISKWDSLLGYFISIILLIAGVKFAGSMSGGAAAIASKLTGFGKKGVNAGFGYANKFAQSGAAPIIKKASGAVETVTGAAISSPVNAYIARKQLGLGDSFKDGFSPGAQAAAREAVSDRIKTTPIIGNFFKSDKEVEKDKTKLQRYARIKHGNASELGTKEHSDMEAIIGEQETPGLKGAGAKQILEALEKEKKKNNGVVPQRPNAKDEETRTAENIESYAKHEKYKREALGKLDKAIPGDKDDEEVKEARKEAQEHIKNGKYEEALEIIKDYEDGADSDGDDGDGPDDGGSGPSPSKPDPNQGPPRGGGGGGSAGGGGGAPSAPNPTSPNAPSAPSKPDPNQGPPVASAEAVADVIDLAAEREKRAAAKAGAGEQSGSQPQPGEVNASEVVVNASDAQVNSNTAEVTGQVDADVNAEVEAPEVDVAAAAATTPAGAPAESSGAVSAAVNEGAEVIDIAQAREKRAAAKQASQPAADEGISAQEAVNQITAELAALKQEVASGAPKSKESAVNAVSSGFAVGGGAPMRSALESNTGGVVADVIKAIKTPAVLGMLKKNMLAAVRAAGKDDDAAIAEVQANMGSIMKTLQGNDLLMNGVRNHIDGEISDLARLVDEKKAA